MIRKKGPGGAAVERNVERPVMNPVFLDEAQSPRRPNARLARIGAALRWIVRGILLVLLFDLVVFRPASRLNAENTHPLKRLFRIVFRMLLFAPLLLFLLVAVMVYCGTHPEPAPTLIDPVANGIYYDPMTFPSRDNTRLEAWVVPFVDARRVLAERDKVLQERRPAVILVHDYGTSRQEMLPLMQPLHDAGFVVLALTLRGCGESAPAAVTFGINESEDVEAAAQMLRRRPFVDPDRIALVGIGTGANACILAAAGDPRIRALVLDHPTHRFDDILIDDLGPRQSWLRWLDPFCKWSFQVAYGLDADQLNMEHLPRELQSRPVLVFDEPNVSCLERRKLGQVVDFFHKHLSDALPKPDDERSESPDALAR